MVTDSRPHTSASGDSAEPVNKRFAGKLYLVLITIKNFENIEPLKIDMSNYGNIDDWLPVENINKVKV